MKKIPYQTNQNNPIVQAYVGAVEKGKRDQHILPRKEGWIVKNLLSDKSSKIFNSQKDAIHYAESVVSQGAAVFIHGLDGRIIEVKN